MLYPGVIPNTHSNKSPSDYLQASHSQKISAIENYGYLYNLIVPCLLHYNSGPIKVLELGVSLYGDGSGHAFSRMPQIAEYVGVDIVPISKPFENRGVFIQGDCDSKECIIRIKQYAPFDLIIHDANHSIESQVLFFREYIELLKKPGIMLVENVYDYDPILQRLNDPTLHIIEVPPVRTQYTRCLVKFNF